MNNGTPPSTPDVDPIPEGGDPAISDGGFVEGSVGSTDEEIFLPGKIFRVRGIVLGDPEPVRDYEHPATLTVENVRRFNYVVASRGGGPQIKTWAEANHAMARDIKAEAEGRKRSHATSRVASKLGALLLVFRG